MLHLLEDDLGGEGGQDAGNEGADGGVGELVEVDGEVERMEAQVLEHLDSLRGGVNVLGDIPG